MENHSLPGALMLALRAELNPLALISEPSLPADL
jgi:hypothetical protein